MKDHNPPIGCGRGCLVVKGMKKKMPNLLGTDVRNGVRKKLCRFQEDLIELLHHI